VGDHQHRADRGADGHVRRRAAALPDGLEITGSLSIFCRGATLHVVLHQTWYRLDLTDITFS